MPALRFGARLIADEQKALVPVDEGLLRDSIRVRVPRRQKKNRDRLSVNAVAGKEDTDLGQAFYAGFVNFGTVSQEADLYATQAFETMWPAAEARVKNEIIRKLEQARYGGGDKKPGVSRVLKRKEQLGELLDEQVLGF